MGRGELRIILTFMLIFLLVGVVSAGGLGCFSWKRGDVNGDNAVDISDALNILGFLFQDGIPPACINAADVDANSIIDISDGIYLLSYLFSGGLLRKNLLAQENVKERGFAIVESAMETKKM